MWWKFSSGERLGTVVYRSKRPRDIILRTGLDAGAVAPGDQQHPLSVRIQLVSLLQELSA